MTSITFSDFLTLIVVPVDDWYKTNGIQFLKGKPGLKPEFTDSELITFTSHSQLPYNLSPQLVTLLPKSRLKLAYASTTTN
jgi:hypothetical protein